jgi:hypothetical protein
MLRPVAFASLEPFDYVFLDVPDLGRRHQDSSFWDNCERLARYVYPLYTWKPRTVARDIAWYQDRYLRCQACKVKKYETGAALAFRPRMAALMLIS